VRVTTAAGSFQGRVIAARLSAEGIAVELRGLAEGPYPLPGEVDVLVRQDDADLARQILLADAVDAAFGGRGPTRRRSRSRGKRWRRLRRRGGR